MSNTSACLSLDTVYRSSANDHVKLFKTTFLTQSLAGVPYTASSDKQADIVDRVPIEEPDSVLKASACGCNSCGRSTNKSWDACQ
ncbi:hypothetical protein CHS0354_036135 [Potamilus streckersoni]|uniref:Uncharacterized protein n=1 Tax=Potamilus streckersoni TaxID=2493646 RepID=A0AAE0W5V2_9BIVA|nr:hypothetical protein CHS0354_036135 [Potamilus streckersoni]